MNNRLPDFLGHIRQAALDAREFTEETSKDVFLTDTRTQRAVIMSLLIIGEAATKVMDVHPAFATDHPETAWRAMRGMRNRIAHGYFHIDLDVVWETVQTALPDLLANLPSAPSD